MYTWVRAYGAGSTSNEVIATLFFILIMIVGNIVLFSVFTAILLQNFENGDDDDEQKEEEEDEDDENDELDNDTDAPKQSFGQRVCGKEARERYVLNFQKAFGHKDMKAALCP